MTHPYRHATLREPPRPPRNWRPFAALLLLCLAIGAVFQCGPTREVLMGITPGVPPREGCTAGESVCRGDTPYACSSSGRFWTMLPPRPDGTPRSCPGPCVGGGDAGVAHCGAEDAGTDAGDDH